MNIHDHGENDPIEFELGTWRGAADKAREHIEAVMGRELTDVEAQP
jgi:hypothetical protein